MSRTLKEVVDEIYEQIKREEIPYLSIKARNRKNLQINNNTGVWNIGNSCIKRSAMKLNGARSILRTLYTIEFILNMSREEKTSTLRELYYISEQWKNGKFSMQDESNKLVEDLEILTDKMRENLRIRPEENGASVIGDLTITEVNRKGNKKKINCKDDVGDGGYALPYNVESEKINFISTNAKFILAIECGGMFDRLTENRFDEKYGAVLVHLKGQPARSTRRFIKRCSEEMNLPVVVFTDGDPWSFRIFASVAYGAIKTSHISDYLATPSAEFMGVTASDIINYNLPTDKLNEEDVNALKAELTDPRFNTEFWKNEIELMLNINKKAEQQSLAKYGLEFVSDHYLPEKLSQMSVL
ncbi:MAG: DNA topoisomerase IV subunit A [Candidatus Thermoplasmatota archaeon]|nr:DNA topoisomerase IV subunit A [Candidatus Thermoplasmatota archaeon]